MAKLHYTGPVREPFLGYVDPQWFGAIADGQSHPLSAFYGSLAAAQVVYPHATALSNEIDWAAAQAAANTGALVVRYSGHYITNRMIAPRDGQTHIVNGTIENRADRYVSPDAYDAACFELGNMHPAALNPAYATPWAVHAVSAITAGAISVTVTTPANVTQPLAVGDIVVIRSENNPGPAGSAITYDFAMWNRVASWDSGTGVLGLELPIPVSIAATATANTLGGPALVINAGLDGGRNVPWRVSQGVKILGGKLIGIAPFHSRSAGWRCVVDVEADVNHLISANAMALSEIRVRGYFSERMIEAKQFCHGTTFWARGIYKQSTAEPKPAISIGEQCYECSFDAHVDLGSNFTAPQRALEVWAQHCNVRARLRHNGSGAHTEVWAVKSTMHLARPPADIDLDLVVESRAALAQYGVVGHDASGDAAADADPTRVQWRVHHRVEAAGGNAVRVQRGTELKDRGTTGSARQTQVFSPGEAPEGARIVFTAAGPVTFAANSETLIGTTFAVPGVKLGDEVRCGLVQTGALSAGTFGDLLVTATVGGVGTCRIYIRNRSATAVTIDGPTALWIWAFWTKNRL